MPKKYWLVEFTAHNMDLEEFPFLTGKICVYARDIFEALNKAKEKVSTFGFDDFVIEKAECSPSEDEDDQ